VREPADVFRLARDEEKLQALREREGYGETSVRNLIAAIEARRDIALERVIYALGVRHVGETTAVTLARGYGSWSAFRQAAQAVAAGDPAARPRWTRSTRSAAPCCRRCAPTSARSTTAAWSTGWRRS
jgi:DNA ligase (NAD+)